MVCVEPAGRETGGSAALWPLAWSLTQILHMAIAVGLSCICISCAERRGILWRWRGPSGLRWVWRNGRGPCLQCRRPGFDPWVAFPGEKARSWGALGEARPGQSRPAVDDLHGPAQPGGSPAKWEATASSPGSSSLGAFELWCWRRPFLRVPWAARRSNQSILATEEDGRDWGQEEKGMTEDEMAGWHHRLDEREFE